MADTTRPLSPVESALADLGDAMASGDDAAITAAREALDTAKAARDASRTGYGAKEVPCYWSTCEGHFATDESARLHAGWLEPIDVPDVLADRVAAKDTLLIRHYCPDGAVAMSASRQSRRRANANA